MASDVASPDPRSKLHSLVRLSRPFLGADLPPAERRAQVLSRMPLAAPARSAGSSWTIPSTALCLSRLRHQHRRKQRRQITVLPVIPGDRNELVECHGEATRGRSPASPDRPIKIVLRRSVESAQYAAGDYRDILQAAAIVQSMSRKGHCWDNAPMKSFFGTLKTELVHHGEYPNRYAARRDLFAYVEGYYNRQRRHSAIGYITPEQAEAKAA